jgi:hypothetical protein
LKLANPKDKYGNPMKHRLRCCNGHHVNDGKRFSWMRRFILEKEGYDPYMAGGRAEDVPDWYLKLLKKEISLIKKERIRETRRATVQEWQNLWSTHFPNSFEMDAYGYGEDDEVLSFNPTLMDGRILDEEYLGVDT